MVSKLERCGSGDEVLLMVVGGGGDNVTETLLDPAAPERLPLNLLRHDPE